MSSAYLAVSPEMAKFLQDNDKSFIGRLIKRKENQEAVMTFLSESGFDIDFSDTTEDTVEVEVRYKDENLGIFECSGLLNLKDEIWGIIKYCYDWYIKRRAEEEADRVSEDLESVQCLQREDS